MKQFFLDYKFPLCFIALMLSLCLFYGYLKIFEFTPRSTHQWRQADTASLVLNYYQDGLDFFKPRMHFIMGGEGYVTGAGEAPIFYYFAAIFYKIFGPQEGIYRLLSLLTFLLGLFLICKIIAIEAQDWFSPILLAGFIFSSPIIAFYSFNFTPNIPAQGLAMIAIWYFYRFYKSEQIRFFYWSMLFYSLANSGPIITMKYIRQVIFYPRHAPTGALTLASNTGYFSESMIFGFPLTFIFILFAGW